jgi:hypothetical protein
MAPRADSKPARAGRPQARLIPTSAKAARPAAARQREAQVAAVVVVVAEVARRPQRRPTSGRAEALRAQMPRGPAQLPVVLAARRPKSGRAEHRPVRRVRRHPMRVTPPEGAPAEREARPASPMSLAGQALRPTTPADPSSVMRRAARSRLVRLELAPA